MDLGLTEEQEMLKKMARDFLDTECPRAVIHRMADDPRGYTPELWQKMADNGWLGLPFPENYGGMGMGFIDLMILLEEMGRACLLTPFFATVVLAGNTVMEAGNEEQKKETLSEIAKGKLIMTLALTEPKAKYDAASITVRAVAEKDNFVISGTKLFVSDANVANKIICVARTGDGNKPEDGITLFLVDAASPGVEITPLKTFTGDKQCEVTFDHVRVSQKDILGDLHKGWPVIENVLQKAIVGTCAYISGAAQKVLEMSVNYAKERVQFDRPIGTQEVIQFYLADMATDVTSAREITYKAGWEVSQGNGRPIEISIAKAWVSDAIYRVTRMGHQNHGALGFTMDHDMHLYYRRSMAVQSLFGSADQHREIVARELGL